jgi:ATPase subunit of ABC transporter with duplicated ATPase domains
LRDGAIAQKYLHERVNERSRRTSDIATKDQVRMGKSAEEAAFDTAQRAFDAVTKDLDTMRPLQHALRDARARASRHNALVHQELNRLEREVAKSMHTLRADAEEKQRVLLEAFDTYQRHVPAAPSGNE